MPIILVEKDPFVEDVVQLNSSPAADLNVRRPLYGTLHKRDQFSHLSVKAVDSNGRVKPLVIHNSSAPDGKAHRNYNYIVQNFSVSRQEKIQIIETFGDEYVFFFGERPTVVQVQGFLINSPDFNWRGEWYKNYEDYLRGSKCVEKKARVYLHLDGMVFIGYIMNTTTQITDAQPRLTPFSFSLLVTNYIDTEWGSTVTVKKQQEARTGGGGEDFPEYLTAVGTEEAYEIQEDGTFKKYSEDTRISPATVESASSAFWITTVDTGMKQFYERNEAVREIAIREYMIKNSVERFDAIQAFNEGNTIFSSKTSISDDILKSLEAGSQGAAVKV